MAIWVISIATAGLALLLSLAQVSTAHANALNAPAKSVQTLVAPCYPPGQQVNCEVSAVVRTGDQVVLANDKQMPRPGDPAVFTLDLKGNQLSGEPRYLNAPVLNAADKYEALTTTLDGKYIIAITGFNKEGTAEKPALDALNTLLYWPVGAPERAKVMAASTRGKVTSSRGLREKISQAIGSPYFQIEALTTAPDGKLLLGIRKHGADSKTAGFAFLLLSIPFWMEGDELTLGETVQVVWKLAPTELAQALGLPAIEYNELGLSGIEFDRYNRDRFYAVTSFEKGDAIGGFLWLLPLEGDTVAPPRPVRLADGSPVRFVSKPEGVEVLDENHVLVVHDDDRIKVKDPTTGVVRQEHEFAYSVITLAR